VELAVASAPDVLCSRAIGNLAQAICSVFKCNLPLHFLPLAALLDHRFGQTLRRIQTLIAETILVRQPALIDLLVSSGSNAHHAIIFNLHR